MSVLEDFPEIPSVPDMMLLRSSFATTMAQHVYMRGACQRFLDPSQPLPPYLSLAIACVGSELHSIAPANNELQLQMDPLLTGRLFQGSLKTMSVMVETDNSEARTIETVLAVVPLAHRS